MTIAGRATTDGTRRFAARFGATDHFRSTPGGLHLSSIGIGTYLGDPDEATDGAYADAIVRAVARGCNVVDSAINYRFQRSERAVGAALRRLVSSGAAARDEILLCTKGGYLSFDGSAPADAREWVRQTFIEPGIVGWDDIIAYNVMHPAYIRHELERSRANLGVETIDVYYLHNPEAQLERLDPAAFHDRLARCFEELEQAAAEGRIGMYGTATWSGYRSPPGAHDHLALADIVAVAEVVAGPGHHFRAVQLPVNLAMTEAFTLENQRAPGAADAREPLQTLLETASSLGVSVFASASLAQAQLTRLPASFAPFFEGLRTDTQRALQFARSTPGVTSALVGMRRTEHVDENLELAGVPPLRGEAYVRLLGLQT
jgi:aryl-alcohol dehydrogenase-like predicted oxidoreductase